MQDRERLPEVRQGITHRFRITDRNLKVTAGYIQTGTYENGKLGEIFVSIGKPGDETAVYDQWAIAISFALQKGISVDDLFRKFVGAQFEPAGATSNEQIPRCTSITDYIARWVILKFGVPQVEA